MIPTYASDLPIIPMGSRCISVDDDVDGGGGDSISHPPPPTLDLLLPLQPVSSLKNCNQIRNSNYGTVVVSTTKYPPPPCPHDDDGNIHSTLENNNNENSDSVLSNTHSCIESSRMQAIKENHPQPPHIMLQLSSFPDLFTPSTPSSKQKLNPWSSSPSKKSSNIPLNVLQSPTTRTTSNTPKRHQQSTILSFVGLSNSSKLTIPTNIPSTPNKKTKNIFK